jgi:hypothetical protein
MGALRSGYRSSYLRALRLLEHHKVVFPHKSINFSVTYRHSANIDSMWEPEVWQLYGWPPYTQRHPAP